MEKNAISNVLDFNYEKLEPIFILFGFKTELKNGNVFFYDSDNELLGNMKKNFFGYEIKTKKGKLEYRCIDDGPSSDGGRIKRNVITLKNTANINLVEVTLGMGLLVDSDVPKMEIKVLNPEDESQYLQYKINSYSFGVEVGTTKNNISNNNDKSFRLIHFAISEPFNNLIYFLNYERVQKIIIILY